MDFSYIFFMKTCFSWKLAFSTSLLKERSGKSWKCMILTWSIKIVKKSMDFELEHFLHCWFDKFPDNQKKKKLIWTGWRVKKHPKMHFEWKFKAIWASRTSKQQSFWTLNVISNGKTKRFEYFGRPSCTCAGLLRILY